MRVLFGIFLASFLFVFQSNEAFAEMNASERPVVYVGPKASVMGKTITLGDIAKIYSHNDDQKDFISTLQGITITDAPQPKGQKTLLGASILEAIKGAGIDPSSIGYSIPQSIVVEREGRVVSKEEVLEVARATVEKKVNLDIKVRDIQFDTSHIVPAGESKVTVETLGEPSSGKLPIRIEMTVQNELAARFLATALVDDWREVPVLNKAMSRGKLIEPADIEVVRLNLDKLPPDVITSKTDAVGLRTKATIAAGEVLRKSAVDVPPTIEKGKKVLMVLKKGPLEATATGIALEDGTNDQVIKLKNEVSKKVVQGKVINSEQVEVEIQ